MRTLLFAVALASLLLPVIAGAEPPPGPNRVGLYTLNDGNGYCNKYMAVGNDHIYLLMTRCDEPSGISGWELAITMPPTVFALDWGIQGQFVNAASPPEFAVGLAVAFPQATAILLADITVFVTTLDPVFAYFTIVSNPSIPGEMAFAAGDDPGNLQPLVHPTGSFANPVFGFNSGPLDPPVATENQTWGGVKSLYR